MQRLGIQAPALNRLSEGEIAGKRVRILAVEGCFGPGYRLLAAAPDRELVEAALQQNGALRLSPASFESLRVEAGQPQAGKELSEDYTPLEAGLLGAVADGKGCYTGQEIIARQLTYDKVTQQLCGLRLPGSAAAGERIYAEGKPAGTLTSFSQSPRFGPIALAILKRPYFQPGTQVAVGSAASEASRHSRFFAFPALIDSPHLRIKLMPERQPFANRLVCITGSGRGIGRAIALHFARLGADVAVNFFRNRVPAEETVRVK